MKRTKILVVEDNKTVRHILGLWLRYWGEFDIREAATGQETLDSMTRDPPDALLLDLTLPDIDGLEVVRRIRALPGPLSQLPIIAITARAMADDRDKALAAGCDEYMTKPMVNAGEIREKLERLLGRGGLTRLASVTSSQEKK